MALAFIPSLGTAISAARPEEGGLASGIVNTSYQVGSALGLAAMTALATAQGADQLGDLAALTDGYSAAFLGAAGIAVVGAALAAALLRTPKADATAATAAERASRSPPEGHPSRHRRPSNERRWGRRRAGVAGRTREGSAGRASHGISTRAIGTAVVRSAT